MVIPSVGSSWPLVPMAGGRANFKGKVQTGRQQLPGAGGKG